MAHIQNESASFEGAPWHRIEEQLREDEAHAINELRKWWMQQTSKEVEAVVPKAIEYGSADLDIIGYALNKFGGANPHTTNDELGIAFYVLGKVARLIGAYTDGRAPSDDTWFDIAIYTKMAQRARAVGEWPGLDL